MSECRGRDPEGAMSHVTTPASSNVEHTREASAFDAFPGLIALVIRNIIQLIRGDLTK